MGLEEEIRNIQLAEEEASFAALEEARKRELQAKPIQDKLFEEQKISAANRAKNEALTTDKLTETLELIGAEKLLLEVQKLWRTGTIDREPRLEINGDYSKAHLHITHNFPYLSEQWCSDIKSKAFGSLGWKRDIGEFFISVGVGVPSIGAPPRLRYDGSDFKEVPHVGGVGPTHGYVARYVYDSEPEESLAFIHNGFSPGFTDRSVYREKVSTSIAYDAIEETRMRVNRLLAERYLGLPNPRDIVDYQYACGGLLDLSPSAKSASWFRRLITRVRHY